MDSSSTTHGHFSFRERAQTFIVEAYDEVRLGRSDECFADGLVFYRVCDAATAAPAATTSAARELTATFGRTLFYVHTWMTLAAKTDFNYVVYL